MLRIYHNPRCSKSRQALALLEEAGREPEVIKYLEEPLDEGRLRSLLNKLGMPVMAVLRSNEKEFKTLGLDRDGVDDKDALDALLTQPRLLQRPIIETDDSAFIARPPERVNELLK